MSEIDNNVMPLAEDPHNLGEFDNVYQAMRRYPNGGTEDDYIYILGVKHFWNTNRQTWGILKDKEDNLVQMVEDFIMLFYNKGYSFAGIAHPDTVPSEYDGVFYIAAENGTYVNFGNNIKVENEVAIISKARKGDWVKTAVAIPNNERIDGIDSLITTIQETLQAHAQAIVGIEGDIDNLYDSIDETNQDLDELGKTVEEYKELNDKKDEEQDDRIDDVEERLDYIPKESFLSSEPACDYHEEDNVDELTADRAMRDRFGRMIDEEYLTRDAAKNYTQEVVDGSKLEIMPGSVKPEDLSPAVQKMIEAGAGKPGNITNLPDEEDLTVSENNVLKLKDKEYNPYNYSGMGRVYLRKHIVNGTNILAQHMINKPNTIYIIQYDYCLGGETIEIPENCVLQFEGGSFRNGTLIFNESALINSNAIKIFEKDLNIIAYKNTFNIKWYGAIGDGEKDDTYIIQKCFDQFLTIYIPNGKYVITSPITYYENAELSKYYSYFNFYPKGINIIGENKSNTIIINESNDYAFKFNANKDNIPTIKNILAQFYTTIKNIQIDGYDKTGSGLYFNSSVGLEIDNIIFKNLVDCIYFDGTNPIDAGTSMGINITNNYFFNSYSGISSIISRFANITIRNCIFRKIEEYAIKGASAGLMIESCSIALCGNVNNEDSGAVKISTPINVSLNRGICINNNIFEANCWNDILLKNAHGISITNNTFHPYIFIQEGKEQICIKIDGDGFSTPVSGMKIGVQGVSISSNRMQSITYNSNIKVRFLSIIKNAKYIDLYSLSILGDNNYPDYLYIDSSIDTFTNKAFPIIGKIGIKDKESLPELNKGYTFYPHQHSDNLEIIYDKSLVYNNAREIKGSSFRTTDKMIYAYYTGLYKISFEINLINNSNYDCSFVIVYNSSENRKGITFKDKLSYNETVFLKKGDIIYTAIVINSDVENGQILWDKTLNPYTYSIEQL